MKNLVTCTIFFAVVLTYNSLLHANVLPPFVPAIHVDNSDYQLNIVEANVPPLKETVFKGKKCFITDCPLTLTNNSNDTLKYSGMSASWCDIYSLNNKDFFLDANYSDVFKNGPVVNVLPPHQSVTKRIWIITYKDYFHRGNLKIGMHIQKVVNIPYAGEVRPIGHESNFVIWSNEVSVN